MVFWLMLDYKIPSSRVEDGPSQRPTVNSLCSQARVASTHFLDYKMAVFISCPKGPLAQYDTTCKPGSSRAEYKQSVYPASLDGVLTWLVVILCLSKDIVNKSVSFWNKPDPY